MMGTEGAPVLGNRTEAITRLFEVMGNCLAAPYNPAAPGRAPRLRPPVLACSDLINACSAPVPVLLNCLFRGRQSLQLAGCNTSKTMILHDFPE